jgi:hypothetical protein
MDEATVLGLGRCIEITISEALAEYRRHYPSIEDLADVIALHVLQMETVSKVRPGGRLEVLCVIEDRNHARNTSHFQHFYRIQPGRYRRSKANSQLSL